MNKSSQKKYSYHNNFNEIFQKFLSSNRKDVQVLILVNKESYCKKKKKEKKIREKVSTQGQHSINISICTVTATDNNNY